MLTFSGFDVAAEAKGIVSYEGDAKKFLFSAEGTEAPSELFTAFKDLMPGDSVTQELSVVNNTKGKKVRIYLRAMPAKAEDVDFLSELELHVVQHAAKGNEKELFDAPADQTATLTDWTLLGTYYYSEKSELTLTLDVPHDLGNEFQDAAAALTWEFMAEVYPLQPGDPGYKTGDMHVTLILGAVFLASLSILFLLLGKRKKEAD